MSAHTIVACRFEPVCDPTIVDMMRTGIDEREELWRSYYAEFAAATDMNGNRPTHEECVDYANQMTR